MSTDQLPNLDSAYAMDASVAEAYRRDGHALLRSVCSTSEIAHCRRVISDAAYRYNRETRPIEERDTYGRAFLQIMNLWRNDDEVKRFVLAKRFARIAAELMGVQSVRLYHDQALYKEPGGGHTPWHQDQYYWPLLTDHAITMWMPLVDAEENMGTMTFASGSQREGFWGHMEISDKSEETFRNLIDERGYRLSSAGAMKAGDATFHSGWTLHGAPGNNTDRTREVMTIIYFEDGARAMEPDNKNRQADLERWLPGCVPGGLAAGPLNPVVYASGD